MRLIDLHVHGTRLLEDFDVTFTRSNGMTRSWTVFVGENGKCKTTILQAIALAASGPEKSNQIAGDLPSRLGDVRDPGGASSITAIFEAGAARVWPGLQQVDGRGLLLSSVTVDPRATVFRGSSSRPGTAASLPVNPLSEIRGGNLSGWLTVGYGVNRTLPVPLSVEPRSDPSQDRVRSLFDPRHQLVGTDFVSRWEPTTAQHYAELVREALIGFSVLPDICAVDLRGRGSVTHPAAVIATHQFDQRVGQGTMRVPAVSLSHGYQSTIAWIADLIGQAMVDAGDQATEVTLANMEGVVLIDEVDLHLHPRWQRTLVKTLKRAFPRMQFIATTHSPMVLAGLEEDEVWLLTADARGSVTAHCADEAARVMTAGGVLQTFFGVDRVDPEDDAGSLLRQYGFLAGSSKRSDQEQAEMETLLARLRALGIEPQLTPVPRHLSPPNGAAPA